MPRATRRGVAPGADRHRGAWRLHPARPGDRARARHAPSSRRCARRCGRAAFRSAEEMRHYYSGDGADVCAVATIAAAGEAGRARAIYSPEPLNRAFGPDGFLRRFDLRGELGRITAPTLVLAGPARLDLSGGVLRGDRAADPGRGPAGVRAQQPLDPQRRAGGDGGCDPGVRGVSVTGKGLASRVWQTASIRYFPNLRTNELPTSLIISEYG